MIGRVATFAHAQSLVASGMKLQAKYADLHAQEASGVKSETLGGLGGDAAQVLRIGARQTALAADTAAATSAQAYVQAGYSAVGDIADLATSIKSQLASVSSTDDSSALQAKAQSWLEDLQGMLNAQHAGSYLFAGQASDQAPVDFSAEAFTSSTDAATANDGYFSGTSTGRSLTTSDGQSIDLTVQADNPAFEKLARALAAIAASPADATVTSAAFELVGQSVDALGTLQETLSVHANALEDLAARNKAKSDTLTSLASSLNGADLSAAAVQVVQIQTQIESLYSTISKLASLSLAKYL
ncbi:flagellin [Phenylobacterium aquaticum]|uniref:flagellin n=1 Tax=Phenylobacterium aquaticum TaxID=1763816 RepID=UPI001F5C4F50|nr:flagellin [Phenylobacterium aquaticum]MCI3131590.1 flagellin [Phenylobacterium aquaticum]